MKREDHILWKIVKAHEFVTELQFLRAKGHISPEQYAKRVEPVCVEVINRLLALIEQDGFIEIAQYNALFFCKEEFDDPERYAQDCSREYHRHLYGLFVADWIVREYEKLMDRFRYAIFEPNPVKRASELVICMDALENCMHGCFWVSGQVMRASPITGIFEDDYKIALHTMYLLYAKSTDQAIEYLMDAIPHEF
jgi:hypothetical protein